YRLLGGVVHRLARLQRRAFEQLAASLRLGPGQADDERHPRRMRTGHVEDASRDLVAARDATEDVDEHAADPGIREDDLERASDDLLLGAAADRSEEHTSELQSPCNLVCRL